MHRGVKSWARPLVIIAATLGVSACGSSRVGTLFGNNESDGGDGGGLASTDDTMTVDAPDADGVDTVDETDTTVTDMTETDSTPPTTADTDTSVDTTNIPDGGDTSGVDTTDATDTTVAVTTDMTATDSTLPTTADDTETTSIDTTDIPDGGDTTVMVTTDLTETDTTDGSGTMDTDTTDVVTTDDPDGGVCEVSFANALLQFDESNDVDSDCSNGLQVNLTVTTDAADGTAAVLSSEGTQIGTATVSDGAAVFETIDLSQVTELSVSLADELCSDTVVVLAECGIAPSCVITYPTDDLLNGEFAPDGDRTSNDLSLPFRTRFEVSTSAEDGSLVLLTLDDETTLVANAQAGVATFTNVQLAPDGQYELVATCQGEANATSQPRVVVVDTVAPVVEQSGLTPQNGQHFPPSSDQDEETDVLDFNVCVPVTSPDAVDVSVDNVCVSVAGAPPVCAPATSDGVSSDVDGACVLVQCPGGAPFDIELQVADAAGNLSSVEVGGVTCASDSPIVQLISLQDNKSAPNDVSRRLLAAGNAEAGLRDESDVTGAQHTVVACTNASVGGSAQLFAGLEGDLDPVAVDGSPFVVSLVAADDRCPEGLSAMAVFSEATLPASATASNGEIQTYTAVRVEVTDVSTEVGQSPEVTVWVDSTIPVVSVFSPAGFCGSIQGTLNETEDIDISLIGGFFPVEAHVEQGGVPFETSYTFNQASDELSITFPAGESTLVATATEPSGNVGSLPTCTLMLGDVATVTWVNPSATTVALGGSEASALNVLPDSDANTPGWQGVLEVSIVPPPGPNDIDGEALQFQVNGIDVGDEFAVIQSGLDPITFTTPTLTIPEGESVELAAVLSEDPNPVVATLELSVDTFGPAAPGTLAATITDRRHTAITLSWTAPADNGDVAVGSYEIAYSDEPIDEENFQDATAVPFSEGGGTTPGAPGASDAKTIDNLTIENDYYFAVRAVDAMGNRGPIAATSSATRAEFETLFIPAPTDGLNSQWGYSVDASTDLTGDGFADMVVGQRFNDRAYIYFGSATGFATEPDVTLIGPSLSGFGISVAVVGDVTATSSSSSNDAIAQDLAIAASDDFTGASFFGRVYIVTGRDWTSQAVIDLSASTPDPVIDFPDRTPNPFHVSRLGDFNGDGLHDFAIHNPAYGPGGDCDGEDNCEGALVVVYGSESFPSVVNVPADTILTDVFLPSSTDFYGYDWLLGVTNLVGVQSGVLAAEWQEQTLRLITLDEQALEGYASVERNLSLVSSDTELGRVPAALLGTSRLAVPITGGRTGTGAGVVEVHALEDNFAGSPRSITAGGGNFKFGQVVIGERYSGRPASYNLPFFGSDASQPAIIAGGARFEHRVPRLYMLKGETLLDVPAGTTAELLATTVVTTDVVYDLATVPGLPAAWLVESPPTGAFEEWHGGIGFPIRDLNSDGYADIGVAEWGLPSDYLSADYDGGIIVLY